MVGHRSEVSVGNRVYTGVSLAETSDSINGSIILLENIIIINCIRYWFEKSYLIIFWSSSIDESLCQ